MPTIQLKLSDQEFADLQDLAGEATGIKSVKYILSEFPVLLANYYTLENKYERLADELVESREIRLNLKKAINLL